MTSETQGARRMSDPTCYIERSKVREIVIGSNTDNETTVEVLKEIDALPIFTAEDFGVPAQGVHASDCALHNAPALHWPSDDLDIQRRPQMPRFTGRPR